MLAKDVNMELEFGPKWTLSEQGGIKTNTMDLSATLGLRYDFHAEGANKCAGAFGPCLPKANTLVPDGGARSLFYNSMPSVHSDFALESGLRYWYSSGRNHYDYYADPTPTLGVSRLDYGSLSAHSGELYFRVDAVRGPLANMFVKGYVGGGAINSGNLVDEDFPPVVNPYSKTQSDATGKLLYGNIDVGYNIFTNKRVRVGAFTGYHYWSETVDAKGCQQIGGNPFVCAPSLPTSTTVITEQDRWNTLRFGGAVDVKLTDRLAWNGEFAFAVTSQRARDTHYLTFGVSPGNGSGFGFQAESVLKYQLTDAVGVGVGGRWWHFETNALDMYNQLLKYETDRYGVFVQGTVKW